MKGRRGMKTLMVLTVALLLGLPVLAVAHDEAKTPISPSIILDMSKPVVPSRDKAYNESLRDPGPAPAKSPLEGVVQPDGSVRYGNTTVIIRHDCPPGGEFFEPPPRPGRRR
jgi:hypothetical protein